jgi:vacuolar-type H+-ATPase subunit F/Vma7
VDHDVKTLALPKHCNEFIQGNYLGPSQGEFDADAEIGVRAALLWELRVGGQVLLTTSEHPFYVPGVGWKTLRELQVGERLLCEDGSTLPIEGVRDKLKWQTVYNFRVANWHTYFVGEEAWGWSLWVHNAKYVSVADSQAAKDTLTKIAKKNKKKVAAIVTISESKYPESAKHIRDAQAAGKPAILTIDRGGADARRDAATKAVTRVPGKQPDEYPPAMTKEGGSNASVRNIDASDNMGAGASMGNQLRQIPDGARIRIQVGQ